MSRDFNNAKVVNSIPEEYDIIAQLKCDCGGNFKVIMQELHEYEEKYYDILICKCDKCENQEEFIFDINRFFGKELGL